MSDISSIEPQKIDHNNHFLFTTIMMKPLSPAQCNHILSLLDAGQSAHQISSKIVIHTSTITRLHLRHHPHFINPLEAILPSFLLQTSTMPLTLLGPGK